MRRSLGLLVAMVVVSTALAACGDTGDGDGRGAAAVAATTRTSPQTRPPEAPPLDDVARAERALVRLADLPDGWSEQAGHVTRLRCGGFEPFAGASAIVRSRRLTQEHSGVQERIALYRSPAAAARALRRLDSSTAVRCLRQELRRRVSEEAGGPARPAEVMRAERLGPTSNARRYISEGVGNYGKFVGYIDAVHARVGRALAALVVVSGPGPPDEALYERVVALVTRRLDATLG
ncbi:MAG TPA: hypothetical protein VF250_10560 [Conexibacter sp.]